MVRARWKLTKRAYAAPDRALLGPARALAAAIQPDFGPCTRELAQSSETEEHDDLRIRTVTRRLGEEAGYLEVGCVTHSSALGHSPPSYRVSAIAVGLPAPSELRISATIRSSLDGGSEATVELCVADAEAWSRVEERLRKLRAKISDGTSQPT